MMDPQSPISLESVIRRDLLEDNQNSLRGNESTLLSRILSSAEGCLPEALVPGVKYLWVPVAVVVGVIAKVNLTYLALSILGLLALQLIYIHLSRSSPSTTDSLELDSLSHAAPGRGAISTGESAEADTVRPDNPTPTLNDLRRATALGNIEQINEILDAGIDINHSSGGMDRTPLMLAASTGNRDVVGLLLDRGAAINQQALFDGATALMIAATNNRIPIIALLVQRGANPFLKNKSHQTALQLARSEGHTETAQAIQHLASRLHPQPDLLKAIRTGDEAGVRAFILEHGTDLNQPSESGLTPLTIAASLGHRGIVSLLLEARANVDRHTTNKEENTALMLASAKGKIDIVQTLLQNGAQINLTNRNGHTALMAAANHGRTKIVQLLATSPGIDVNYRTSKGTTALSIAKQTGYEETAKALIALGATDGRIETAAAEADED